MVRPSSFGFNPETAADNVFQQPVEGLSAGHALAEFDALVSSLTSAGVVVEQWQEPPGSGCPDALFPNNWVSFAEDGRVVLYPMMAPSRRLERRPEAIRSLQQQGYSISAWTDLTAGESKGVYLEGTGSLVLDHIHRMAYASVSERTHPSMVEQWCEMMGYEPVLFHSSMGGVPVYHTNVILSIGTTWAVLCPDAIAHAEERSLVCSALESTGRMVLHVTPEQVRSFAANILELADNEGGYLVACSGSAWRALTAGQRTALEHHARLVPAEIPTIERFGGGSVRCMLAEVFLPRVKY